MTASAVVRSLRSLASISLLAVLCGFALTEVARAEVLVRWDRDQTPSPDTLGLSTLVIPAKNKAAAQRALEQGYSVILEVEASALAAFAPPAGRVTGVIVKGTATRAQLSALRLRLKPRGIAVRTLEERGKWPHIRSNWVTNENGVLQVSSRTQQPWIENNAALIKIAQVTQPDTTPLLTYPWTPITLSEIQEGPALENYLVAIAEAGSFGADLVLPLHERFENDLLLGLPQARAWWTEMRRAIAFYASNLTNRYQAAATIGVVTADPMRWFEVMNLLARHTLPFDLIPRDKFAAGAGSASGAGGAAATGARRDLSNVSKLDLLAVLDPPDARQVEVLTKFAENGGIVVLPGVQGKFPWQSATPAAKTEMQTTYAVGKGRIVEHRDPPANPDAFAQQVRQLLGRDGRVLQTWNGITVIAARYEAAADPSHTVLLTAVNYSHQELPLQVRVPGKFSAVHYESPETGMTLLPYQQRDGFTEFVLPALHIGARVFLTPDAAAATGSR